MSSAVERQIQDELHSCSEAHRHLLGVLFAVTQTTPRAPLPDPHIDSHDLRRFVELNSLKDGRRFDETSLPSRPTRDWTSTPPQDNNINNVHHQPSQPAPSPAGKSRPPDLSITTSDSPAAQPLDPTDAEEDGYGAAIPTPRSALDFDHDQSTSRPHKAITRGRDPRVPPDKAHKAPQSPPASPRPTADASRPDASRTRASARLNHDDHAQPENASSPSSSAEARSANTSRADGRSTATSPEQEAIPQDQEVSTTQQESRKRQRDVDMPDAPAEIAPMSPASTKPTIDPASTRPSGLANDEDIPMPKRKRRKTTDTENYSIVLAKPGPSEKDVELVRTYQRFAGADERFPSKKKDWMHLLFLRQALDQSHGHKSDLVTLLGSSNKVLSTSDWQSQLREKQDCAIIKRIYEWQQVSRWPLRQLRLPTDFPAPTSHQDCLIAEMKWLKTDFREERKFKVSICAQLAQSCAEWCSADRQERETLQVRPDLPIASMNLLAADDEITPAELSHEASVFKQHEFYLDENIAKRLPLFEPISLKGPEAALRNIVTQASADDASALAAPSEQDKPAEDDSCALFQPEWEALRRRQQAPFAFKPPNTPMPPPSFYENRRASQWTEDEDRQLKAWAKDFPSNWSLIAERHNQKSHYVPAIQRRTPWECYERFVMLMEGAATDPTTRQYAKQFQSQLERIRAKWSVTVQQQAQQAQNNGQQYAAPRFPLPVRVERRQQNKRFLGLIDAARKLARKREAAESTRRQAQENSAHAAAQAQQNNAHSQQKSDSTYTPEALSLLKHKRQMELNEKQERVRAQQRAFLAHQQRSALAGGQTAAMNSAQRLANGQPGSAPQTNGHLAVPGQGQQQRQFSQQQQQLQQAQQQPQPQGQQFQVPNGASTSQMQQMLAMQQAQQRLQRQQDPNLQQQMMRQQSQGMQFQGQRPMSNQAQLNRAAGNNAAMLGQFSQSQSGDSNQAQHSFATNEQGVPQSLSSGRVPAVAIVQHQIAQQNPGISKDELDRLTSEQLNRMIESQRSSGTTALDRSRQNAINAATGLHGAGQHSRQSSSGQHSVQAQAQNQAAHGAQQQSANGYNSMLASNNLQARSASPGQGQSSTGYANQMRQAVSQQMQRNGVQSGSMARPAASMASPSMQAAQQSGQQAQRPASSSMQPPTGPGIGQLDASRPGSAQMAATPRIASQSPRPVSSQSQAAQS